MLLASNTWNNCNVDLELNAATRSLRRLVSNALDANLCSFSLPFETECKQITSTNSFFFVSVSLRLNTAPITLLAY